MDERIIQIAREKRGTISIPELANDIQKNLVWETGNHVPVKHIIHIIVDYFANNPC